MTFLLMWSLPTGTVAVQHCIAHSAAFLYAEVGNPCYNLYRKTIPHNGLPVEVIIKQLIANYFFFSAGGFSYTLLMQIYEVHKS